MSPWETDRTAVPKRYRAMPDNAPKPSASPADRPSNREVENENQRPAPEGGPPRPATEPHGAEDSTQSPKTRSDPGSGES
jgi:hypothetical protein